MKHAQFIHSFLLCALALLFACAVVYAGYKTGVKNSTPEDNVVEVPASIFYNADSLSEYTRRAYLVEDDTLALFVTAAAYYLRCQGDLPDTLTTVSRDDAEIMLLRSAQLGYQPAIQLIHCLHNNGCWNHSIPE